MANNSSFKNSESIESTSPATYTSPKPSLRLLFMNAPHGMVFTALFPACLVSIMSGGVAPFMTLVVGQGFQAFSTFSTSVTPNAAVLTKQIGMVSLELAGLALGSVLLSSVMSALWTRVGEKNVRQVRRVVYRHIITREMAWFDLKVTSRGTQKGDTKGKSGGAAGLMTTLSR